MRPPSSSVIARLDKANFLPCVFKTLRSAGLLRPAAEALDAFLVSMGEGIPDRLVHLFYSAPFRNWVPVDLALFDEVVHSPSFHNASWIEGNITRGRSFSRRRT